MLFFVLAILENSGYLSKAAFVMDRVMYKCGRHKMTDFELGKGKTIGLYAAVLGVLYLAIGVIEVFGGAGDAIPGDLLGGLALVVIAATFLNGVKGSFDGEHIGLSFIIGGLLPRGSFRYSVFTVDGCQWVDVLAWRSGRVISSC